MNLLLQKMFVGIVVDKKTGADDTVVENVKAYLHRAVGSALHMLPKGTSGTSAFGDCSEGSDDSDKE